MSFHMESSLWLFWVLITLVMIHILQAQDQLGFISLDCGLSADEPSPYKERYTGLWFYSDENFIQSGITGRVQELQGYLKQYETLRYFPDGIRNCYSLSVEKGSKYLIRAVFVYGNYDGLENNPKFDLYLGPNRWKTIDLQAQVNGTLTEILHIPTSNSLQICLVKTGKTTPLISALELRPMRSDSYVTKSGSLKVFYRYYLTKSSTSTERYPDDVNDRTWDPYFQTGLTEISTALDVSNSNEYVPPKSALKTAAMPTNVSAPLTIEWTSENLDDQFYLYAYFAEIQDLQANETREFNIVWNGEQFYGSIVPRKLALDTIFSRTSRTCNGRGCSIQLIRTNRSTLPPLLNAFEVYKVIQFPQSETDESDVGAMKNIAASYGLSRINWQGDPCVPQKLRWDGLNCSSTDMATPPRITTLNLSSSGLNGTISAAIKNLTQLEKLDLSNNNLTGEIPEFLGNMKSLSVINLSGNNFNGSIPQALRKKGLELSVEGNPRLCLFDTCRKPSKKKIILPIVVSAVSAALVIALLILFLLLRKKKSTIVEAGDDMTSPQSLQFEFATIEAATDRFSRNNKLGQGGFGEVYKGMLQNETEIAVKRLSRNSGQGTQEFRNEVMIVAKLQHKNLVRLLGFCLERDEQILVYEFVPNKSLDYFLFDPTKKSQLDWTKRYNIIGGITRGLLYLHQDSRLTIIHRDIKASNILLDIDMNPKIADFGMARNFRVDQTEDNTGRVVGTFGYMPPEYVTHGQFSTKSDVYSFGVLILEIVSGRKNSSFSQMDNSEGNLVTYVWRLWNNDSALDLIDPTIMESYEKDEVIRCIHIGLLCVQESPADRPSMSTIFQMLTNSFIILPMPRPPGFFLRNRPNLDPLTYGSEPGQSSSKSIPCSINNDSITRVTPR